MKGKKKKDFLIDTLPFFTWKNSQEYRFHNYRDL